MIKVGEKIEEIIKGDHEALFCLSRGILNLSSYARGIHEKVEMATKKEVKLPTIIMALSRLSKKMTGVVPLLKEVAIDGMTVKTPLAEVVFEKTSFTISKLSVIQKNIKAKNDEWFSFSQNSKAIIVICSESRIDAVVSNMNIKPLLILKDLTAIGLSINARYHASPNITFSLLHKIAEREIPLAEIFTTRDEMMFIFETKYLSQVVEIFQKD
ncbi:MAG: hypothetical protein WCW04_02640 [Candidatus Paceibacterota bacterium]